MKTRGHKVGKRRKTPEELVDRIMHKNLPYAVMMRAVNNIIKPHNSNVAVK